MQSFPEFQALYEKSAKIATLKELDNPEYRAFRTKKGSPVGLVSIKHMREFIPHDPAFYNFFNEGDIFWIVPCDLVDQRNIGFVLRTFHAKNYRVITKSEEVPFVFGLHQFLGYQKGNPIVLTEGVKDALYLQQFYPFVLSLLTSNVPQEVMALIKAMTDKVVLSLDNDPAGKKATIAIQKQFLAEGISSVTVFPPRKDWGECFDLKCPEDFKTAIKLVGGKDKLIA